MMNTDTPETDTYAIKFKTPCGQKYWVPVDIARKLERELAEARGQRDRLAELHKKNADHFNELLELCGTLRKERNRLAAVLQSIRDGYGGQVAAPDCCEDCEFLISIDKALQSLTPKP